MSNVVLETKRERGSTNRKSEVNSNVSNSQLTNRDIDNVYKEPNPTPAGPGLGSRLTSHQNSRNTFRINMTGSNHKGQQNIRFINTSHDKRAHIGRPSNFAERATSYDERALTPLQGQHRQSIQSIYTQEHMLQQQKDQ